MPIPNRFLPSAPAADLVLRGELDLAQRQRTAASLRELVTILTEVTVDLSGVTFMDCAGINILLNAHADAVRSNSKLRIVAISEPARRTLTVGNLVRPFPVGALRPPSSTSGP